MNRRIVAPVDLAFAVFWLIAGGAGVVVCVATGDYWPVALPTVVLIAAGLWVIRREWKRRLQP